jgi:hypothetical protein
MFRALCSNAKGLAVTQYSGSDLINSYIIVLRRVFENLFTT